MAESARDYLADDFDAQGEAWDGEFAIEYESFADFLRALPGEDEVCQRLGVALRPFIDNDERIDGTLYPDGDAMRFMVRHVPPTETEHRHAHAQMFADCAENDHARWQAAIAADGVEASWTVAGGRPAVTFTPPHDEDPLA